MLMGTEKDRYESDPQFGVRRGRSVMLAAGFIAAVALGSIGTAVCSTTGPSTATSSAPSTKEREMTPAEARQHLNTRPGEFDDRTETATITCGAAAVDSLSSLISLAQSPGLDARAREVIQEIIARVEQMLRELRARVVR